MNYQNQKLLPESETSDLRKLSTEELQILLDDAVREEDYDPLWKSKKNSKDEIKKLTSAKKLNNKL